MSSLFDPSTVHAAPTPTERVAGGLVLLAVTLPLLAINLLVAVTMLKARLIANRAYAILFLATVGYESIDFVVIIGFMIPVVIWFAIMIRCAHKSSRCWCAVI